MYHSSEGDHFLMSPTSSLGSLQFRAYFNNFVNPFYFLLLFCYHKYTAMARKKEYTVEAFYVGESIDLRRAEDALKRYIFLNRDHPLVIQFTKDSYIALTKFGVVVFWNVSESERQKFLQELSPYIKSIRPRYSYSETSEVFISEHDNITAKGIHISILEVERIKLVSFAIAQSVALERYEEEVEEQLAELETVITNLKTTGKALLRESDLLKQVGRIMVVKQITISHLSLFDKPEEAWESPELEKLYSLLAAEFELEVRFSVLDKKIEFLSESSKILMEFLAEKRSAFLEWIIIILIAVGLIPYIGDIARFLKSILSTILP